MTKPTVLVVDDEKDIRESLRLLIEAEVPGSHVETASSGPAALDILRKEKVDLIVADYRMPGMDGLKFLAEARKLKPGIPNMMMTAYPDPDLAARAVKEYGVGLFVAKPVNLDYFVQVISAFLKKGSSLESNQPGSGRPVSG